MSSIQIDRTDGLSSATAIKGPCRAATTANITLIDPQTIDGVAVVAGDRVLVKDQTEASENGIYVVDTGPWRRAADFKNNRDVRKGTRVWVTDGTVRAETDFLVATENPIVIGTTAIAFVAANASIGDGGVGTLQLADGAVTEPKHATGGVSTRALAAGAATLVKIGDDAKADFRMVDPNGSLPRVIYNGASSVRVAVSSYAMGGFWFRGRYSNSRARFVAVNDPIFDWTTDYGAGTIKLESWQALFFCATDADSIAIPKIMPYLRVHSVSGSVITLNKAGEGISAQDAASDYGWANNELVGAKCLVISEAGAWSTGRVATVTANTKTTITLDNIGAIGGAFVGNPSLDWVLVAPPGYDLDEFVWVGDFYADTAEVRNIYMGGTMAVGKMIHILQPSASLTGAVAGPPGTMFNTGGYISPLATGFKADVSSVLSTSATGGFAEYFDADGGNHIVHSKYTEKGGSGSLSIQHDAMYVNFLYHGRFNYYNAGSVASGRINGQVNITGWVF